MVKKAVQALSLELFSNSFKRVMIVFCIMLLTLSICTNAVYATNVNNEKSRRFEEKVAKNFAKKFCNSIGFGLSTDSALRFALGESKLEVAGNELMKGLNANDLKNNISQKTIDKCGYGIDLNNQEGVEEFKSYLSEAKAFEELGGNISNE